jgi:hypothetical protein
MPGSKVGIEELLLDSSVPVSEPRSSGESARSYSVPRRCSMWWTLSYRANILQIRSGSSNARAEQDMSSTYFGCHAGPLCRTDCLKRPACSGM